MRRSTWSRRNSVFSPSLVPLNVLERSDVPDRNTDEAGSAVVSPGAREGEGGSLPWLTITGLGRGDWWCFSDRKNWNLALFFFLFCYWIVKEYIQMTVYPYTPQMTSQVRDGSRYTGRQMRSTKWDASKRELNNSFLFAEETNLHPRGLQLLLAVQCHTK